ncbi:NTF2-like protein [Polychaeton citri CBS 116435]|uniref:NTF2-like protein n=1 Tax=Polychaeton citri CBS 116435 TaxID=1314669 RepID=A0A9P4UP01_9PEZI|nr:NTF2-like protein [Polychaeton citri CBS 116435]
MTEDCAINGANGLNHKVPEAKAFSPLKGVSIQPPLSRRGVGPGLILILDESLDLRKSTKTLDPPPLQKWAEEGYAVAQISSSATDFEKRFNEASYQLKDLETCESMSGFGLISYLEHVSEHLPSFFHDGLREGSSIRAIVSYGAPIHNSNAIPQLVHCSPSSNKLPLPTNQASRSYDYVDSPHFAIPSSPTFSPTSAALSHTRSLTFLKPLLGGPYFDLEAIWEEHTKFEFGERDVEATMATMVAEPYVNHIPTMTGGVGRERLTDFYRMHFVFANPDDTSMRPVSRTVGIDRVIDEFVFQFTHDRVVDWILPGIPPTGRKVEVPFTSVVNIRGDRLYHEHIAWDQATVLRQLGLIPEYLPFPYSINGQAAPVGKRYEYRVPTAGIETAQKLADESSVTSNGMFQFSVREVDKS